MNLKSAEKAMSAVMDYIRSLERELETMKRMNTALQEKIVILTNEKRQ
jgi:hypothetical protein